VSEAGGTRGWWIAGGGGLLIAILVIVALTRDPVELDPSTPEGSVQVYLQAIADEDYGTAFALIDPDSHEDCKSGDLAFASPRDPFTATLGTADVSNGTAYVEVTISQNPSPGPFDPGSGGYGEVFTLEQSDGQWLITGEPWPYFRWRCPPEP
jgi:hypothetical protein